MKIDNPPWANFEDLRELLEVLNPALIVGGAVRNSLLGLQISDIDLATELLPDEVTKRATKAGFQVIPTGIIHGTVTCVKNGSYEVTTLRVDKATDGRHAVVEFSNSWEEDAKRRDFTMNALYCDFEGEVFDWVNGMEDLRNRYLNFIGDPELRIREDYLRILRFFRFYAHYCDKYDEASLNACLELANNLRSISRERCTYEFLRMLQAKDANKSIQIMSQEIFDAAGLPLPTSTTSEALANQKLSIYAKLSTFSPQQELILSRHMSRLVRELQNLDNMHTLFDYASWINSCSDEILWDGIHLKGQNQQILPELQVWIDNKFPLKGKDLLELGVEPGPDVSKFLNQAKNHFCSQPKPISYQELMEYMKKVV